LVEESDKNLVIRAKNGDHDAFRGLVERYQRKVYSVAFSMVRNPDDAMDLSQDAFVKAYRNLKGFQGTSSFYTWIYRIVVNLGIDHIRKSGRVHKVDYDDKIRRKDEGTGDMSILPSRLDADPSKVLMRRELLDKMQAALETLSPNHRTILLLREVEGLSYDEMSEILDVSKGTVMSRLHHARKNMQRALKGYVHKEQTD
jgi:RNA polymerase sigma-70 factor (ECF subfamily)